MITPNIPKDLLMNKVSVWAEQCPRNISAEFKRAMMEIKSGNLNHTQQTNIATRLLELTFTADPLFASNPYSERSMMAVATAVYTLDSSIIRDLPGTELDKEPEVKFEDVQVIL